LTTDKAQNTTSVCGMLYLFMRPFQAPYLHIVTTDNSWLIIVLTCLKSPIGLTLKSGKWQSKLWVLVYILQIPLLCTAYFFKINF
jgi:hypothetical protein